MDINNIKDLINNTIDYERDQLIELSLRIFNNPESGFEERKASEWITDCLEKEGFTLERGICDLPTAFKANYGKGEPQIAIMCEYDALPNLGHACGHNLIAAAATGAAFASKLAVDEYGGRLVVFGTPAEEFYGGKVLMAEKGVFDNLSAALMVHPGWEDSTISYTYAAQNLEVEFIGKTAHASAQPDEGINALEAMIQSYVSINSLRQQTCKKGQIHGIITNGGEAPNVIPAFSSASFFVRATDDEYLEVLKQKVLNCFIAAETATGAKLGYNWSKTKYNSFRNNTVLSDIVFQNMQKIGRNPRIPGPDEIGGSTDMGNVSHIVPSVHAWLKITRDNIKPHSPEFLSAVMSEEGNKSIIDGAKIIAMSVADILSHPSICAQILKEHHKQV